MPARHWEVIVQASTHVFVVVLHASIAAPPPAPAMQLAVVRHSTQRIVAVLHCRASPSAHMALVVHVATHVLVVVSHVVFIAVQFAAARHSTHVPAGEQ